MNYVAANLDDIEVPSVSTGSPITGSRRIDPRIAMHQRLPQAVQPLLTWITAKPAPGEALVERSPLFFVRTACAQTAVGVALAWVGMAAFLPWPLAAALVATGLLLSTSGLGLFQVVVFHHCSHGTVFKNRERNGRVGRLISALLLFRHFDAYKRGHMLHHSTNKLLTAEDEFTDFVFHTCKLEAAVPKRRLWVRVVGNMVSPVFHAGFLWRRVQAAAGSPDRDHNMVCMGAWISAATLAAICGQFAGFLVAIVLPVSVLLQVATVMRILCEHSFPEPELIEQRGRDFACHATSGVFPGSMPPEAGGLRGALRQALWWVEMLTVQLFVRMFVLVGDAPCHDYHHRRPASRRWTSYIQARQMDVDAGSPGFGARYNEVWGLFRALDQTLDSLSRTPEGVVLH